MIPLKNIKRLFSKALRQPGYALSVFQKRLLAYLFYKFGRGKSSNPEAITFFLTHRCNLRCKMCGQWGESGATRQMDGPELKLELPLEEIKKVIDEVAGFKPNITLFGGEPLIYKNCIELIKHIKAKGMHCLMVTNGSLLSANAEELVKSGLDELNLSLDGGRELHDQIRGLPGLYDRIMEGIVKVNRLKHKKPLINLQCTITKYNLEKLDQMVKTAEEAGADSLTFHNLIFIDIENLEKQKEVDRLLSCSNPGWSGFLFNPEIDPDLLWSKIQQIKSAKIPIDFYPNFSLEELKRYYKDLNYRPKEYRARCLSPWIVSYIFPDGEMRPCLNTTYSFGNVTRQSFAGVWNSPAAQKFRRTLKEKNIFPACVRCTELYRY